MKRNFVEYKVRLLPYIMMVMGINFLDAQNLCTDHIDLKSDVLIVNDATVFQSENSVFISPKNKNVVFNSNNSHQVGLLGQIGSTLGVSDFFTNNGGATSLDWSGSVNNFGGNGDPSVVIDYEENFYVSHISSTGDQEIMVSGDYGSTWSTYTIATNTGNFSQGEFLDKGHLWIDNSSASPFFGNLYAGWTPIFNTASSSKIEVARSTNQGQAWNSLQTISNGPFMNPNPSTRHAGVNIQTSRNGYVFACWAVYDLGTHETAIGFNWSDDGGASWKIPKRIQPIANGLYGKSLGDNKTMKINSFPCMTVNKQTGEIFIVWSEFAAPGIDADIFFIKSSDNGSSWSPQKMRVNQDAIQSKAIDQWLPWIACDEVSGALVVLYYDGRNKNNTYAETYASISYDNGDNWTDYLVSECGKSWDGNSIPGAHGGYAGDYIGVDVYRGRAMAIWSDNADSNFPMTAYAHPFDLPCPHNLSLCNAVIKGSALIPGEAAYNVDNIITVAGSGCGYQIESTGNVSMQAGMEIQLKEGFSAKGEFKGIITPCTSFSQRLVNSAYGETSNPGAISGIKARDSYDFSVFPNPTSGKFSVALNNVRQLPNSIVVEDLLGRKLVSVDKIQSSVVELDLENCPAGLFLIKINYPDRTVARQLVKN